MECLKKRKKEFGITKLSKKYIDIFKCNSGIQSSKIYRSLSVRSLNCLKHAEVFTLGELVSFSKNDLLKFRNFGKKSLTELEELVEDKNLHFGFDVSKYNLNNNE